VCAAFHQNFLMNYDVWEIHISLAAPGPLNDAIFNAPALYSQDHSALSLKKNIKTALSSSSGIITSSFLITLAGAISTL
jgi:hypothetical protein